MKATQIMAVGGIYVDINCPNAPFGNSGLHVEEELVAGDYEEAIGGSGPNFAKLAAHLGLPVTVVAKTGDDRMNSVVGMLLSETRFSPDLIVDRAVSTNVSINMVNAAGAYMSFVGGTANQSITADEVMAKLKPRLSQLSHLYIGGSFKLKALLPGLGAIIQAAKAAGVKVALDHSRIYSTVSDEQKALVRTAVAEVDYYFPSKQEFLQLWAVDSIDEGLHKLGEHTTAITVVKDSDNGALVMHDGEVVRVPAYAVHPIHTVGAGDSFNAGFMVAQADGRSVQESMRFGCAAAGLTISRHEMPTASAIVALVAGGQS